jgi:hypothetical protein
MKKKHMNRWTEISGIPPFLSSLARVQLRKFEPISPPLPDQMRGTTIGRCRSIIVGRAKATNSKDRV